MCGALPALRACCVGLTRVLFRPLWEASVGLCTEPGTVLRELVVRLTCRHPLRPRQKFELRGRDAEESFCPAECSAGPASHSAAADVLQACREVGH